MKLTSWLAPALIAGLTASTPAPADSCKPAKEWADAITKQKNVQWEQNMTQKGFWKSMVSKDIDLFIILLRWGPTNVINIQLTTVTNDRDAAAYDSTFRGAKGDRIVLGLKGGEPLMLVATEVANSQRIEASVGLVRTVILSAHVADGLLLKFKTALTTTRIDAIRVFLASGQVDRAIDDDNGKAMMEKFGCFYKYLDKHNVVLKATDPSEAAKECPPGETTSVPGRYAIKGNSSDYLELKGDGAFFVQRGAKGFAGTYKVDGDVITMQMPTGQATRGKFCGTAIADADGLLWEKAQEPKTTSSAKMTVEQVTQMVVAKLPDDVIISSIRKSGTAFDVTPEVLIRLKTAGASDAVIRAITR